MELPDIVNEIIDYIPTIDFSVTSEQVSLFETTIRYLGGMLAGYDLLKGPLSSLAANVWKLCPALELKSCSCDCRTAMLMLYSLKQRILRIFWHMLLIRQVEFRTMDSI